MKMRMRSEEKRSGDEVSQIKKSGCKTFLSYICADYYETLKTGEEKRKEERRREEKRIEEKRREEKRREEKRREEKRRENSCFV